MYYIYKYKVNCDNNNFIVCECVRCTVYPPTLRRVNLMWDCESCIHNLEHIPWMRLCKQDLVNRTALNELVLVCGLEHQIRSMTRCRHFVTWMKPLSGADIVMPWRTILLIPEETPPIRPTSFKRRTIIVLSKIRFMHIFKSAEINLQIGTLLPRIRLLWTPTPQTDAMFGHAYWLLFWLSMSWVTGEPVVNRRE